MVGRLVGDESEVHVVGPELAHHLRSDIPERDKLFCEIFELGTGLTQRRFRHHGVGFSNGGIPGAPFKPPPSRTGMGPPLMPPCLSSSTASPSPSPSHLPPFCFPPTALLPNFLPPAPP